MKKSLLTNLFLFVCLCGALPVTAQTENPTEQTANGVLPPPRLTAEEKRGYPLGVGDEVEIRVLGESDWNGSYTVDEDGKVLLPFVETPIMAACKTDRALRADVIKALQKFIREPQVFVRVTARNSRPPAVLTGAIRNPQQFDMRRNVTLFELYSYSGGITEESNGIIKVYHTKSLQCVEPDTAHDDTEIADAKTLTDLSVPSKIYKVSQLREGINEANPVVRPGDIVFFDKTSPVYITGQVRAPQGIYIPERGLTLVDAIAKVQGFQDDAKKKDVRIYRLKSGSVDERDIIAVNYNLIKEGKQKDVALQPYDIVEIGRGAPNVLEIVKGIAIGGGVQAGQFAIGNLPMRVLY